MLREERLLQIALCVSLSGLAMLALLAESIEPRQVKISEINESLAGWTVMIEARVLSKYEKDGAVFLQLYDGTGKIKAVMFRPGEETRSLLQKDSFAAFEGKVQVYREELEIVVERVEEWR